MLRAFSTSATGMAAQQTMVDVIANNLANINTTGFKKSQVSFQDLLYIKLKNAGAEVVSGLNSPSGLEVGSGVRTAATVRVYTGGELQSTERPLDIAITGDGFLQVSMPNGDIKYTRDGSLQTNADGELVTSTGYRIEPAISIPTDITSLDIGKDGSVNVTDSAGTQSVVGTIELARFPNPSGLSAEGENLLAATEASGTATTGTAGDSGFGIIQSGFLEKSNVQMITELVNLITAQRAYETNSRAIRAGDEMLRKANEIARF
ncbi:MAG: flagellar basal-body rod protein FlgG [Planctomycetes bacterium]|nr:flagellar basal-body rod protein FlgG [Planctomycetota bacterium]MBL7145882.1 flagellar basal-body rod protein FlgG [Phycisphaerae bacterium]